MVSNITPYTFAIVDKYIYFISTRYNYIENDEVEEGTLLNATNDSLDPFDYHLEKCGIHSFKKLESSLTHTCWPRDDEEDIKDRDDDLVEAIYCNGTNEVVKIFNQKFLICYERDSVYASRQWGHHCFCYQKKVVLIY